MPVKIETNDAIIRTAERFMARTLPKSEWTHEAHFAVALYLVDHAAYDPFVCMPDMIRAYNVATGASNTESEGYHETITFASLSAATHIAGTIPSTKGLHTALETLMHSKYGRSDWLLEHWTKTCLFSSAARKDWVPPDLSPLPFPGPLISRGSR